MRLLLIELLVTCASHHGDQVGPFSKLAIENIKTHHIYIYVFTLKIQKIHCHTKGEKRKKK